MARRKNLNEIDTWKVQQARKYFQVHAEATNLLLNAPISEQEADKRWYQAWGRLTTQAAAATAGAGGTAMIMASRLPEQYKSLILTVLGTGGAGLANAGLNFLQTSPHLGYLSETISVQQHLQDVVGGNLASTLLADSINSLNRDIVRSYNTQDITRKMNSYMSMLDKLKPYADEVFPDQVRMVGNLVNQEFASNADKAWLGATGLFAAGASGLMAWKLLKYLTKRPGDDNKQDGKGGGPNDGPPPPVPPPDGAKPIQHSGSSLPELSSSQVRQAEQSMSLFGLVANQISGSPAPGIILQNIQQGLGAESRRLETKERESKVREVKSSIPDANQVRIESMLERKNNLLSQLPRLASGGDAAGIEYTQDFESLAQEIDRAPYFLSYMTRDEMERLNHGNIEARDNIRHLYRFRGGDRGPDIFIRPTGVEMHDPPDRIAGSESNVTESEMEEDLVPESPVRRRPREEEDDDDDIVQSSPKRPRHDEF